MWCQYEAICIGNNDEFVDRNNNYKVDIITFEKYVSLRENNYNVMSASREIGIFNDQFTGISKSYMENYFPNNFNIHSLFKLPCMNLQKEEDQPDEEEKQIYHTDIFPSDEGEEENEERNSTVEDTESIPIDKKFDNNDDTIAMNETNARFTPEESFEIFPSSEEDSLEAEKEFPVSPKRTNLSVQVPKKGTAAWYMKELQKRWMYKQAKATSEANAFKADALKMSPTSFAREELEGHGRGDVTSGIQMQLLNLKKMNKKHQVSEEDLMDLVDNLNDNDDSTISDKNHPSIARWLGSREKEMEARSEFVCKLDFDEELPCTEAEWHAARIYIDSQRTAVYDVEQWRDYCELRDSFRKHNIIGKEEEKVAIDMNSIKSRSPSPSSRSSRSSRSRSSSSSSSSSSDENEIIVKKKKSQRYEDDFQRSRLRAITLLRSRMKRRARRRAKEEASKLAAEAVAEAARRRAENKKKRAMRAQALLDARMDLDAVVYGIHDGKFGAGSFLYPEKEEDVKQRENSNSNFKESENRNEIKWKEMDNSIIDSATIMKSLRTSSNRDGSYSPLSKRLKENVSIVRRLHSRRRLEHLHHHTATTETEEASPLAEAGRRMREKILRRMNTAAREELKRTREAERLKKEERRKKRREKRERKKRRELKRQKKKMKEAAAAAAARKEKEKKDAIGRRSYNTNRERHVILSQKLSSESDEVYFSEEEDDDDDEVLILVDSSDEAN
eukprot:g2478.t1